MTIFMEIKRDPDYTTKSGARKWVSNNSFGDVKETVITSEFPKSHIMRANYGIQYAQQHRYSDGRKMVTLEGDVFQKPFSFSASNGTNSNTNVPKAVQKFLTNLKQVRGMKIPEEAIDVLKYVKK